MYKTPIYGRIDTSAIDGIFYSASRNRMYPAFVLADACTVEFEFDRQKAFQYIENFDSTHGRIRFLLPVECDYRKARGCTSSRLLTPPLFLGYTL